MKILLPLLVLSVVGNAVLALGPWHRSAASSAPRAAPSSVALRRPDSSTVPPRAKAILLASDLRQAMARRDPKSLLEALRRAGFPERMVRDIVMAEIYADRSEEMLANARRESQTPFWRLGEERMRLQQLYRDYSPLQRDKVREVFGGRMPSGNFDAGNNAIRYRFLPGDKIAAVAEIDADYGQMAADAMRIRGPGPADRGALKLLDQERRADLSQVLSTQEMELYDLHLSSTAESLRRHLGEFQPTESEFRALYGVRRPYDEQQGNVSFPGFSSFSSSGDPRVTEQYRTVLSPERFAELERAHNQGYRAAAEIARHYGLPATAAAETFALQKDYEGRMREVWSTAGTDRAGAASAAKALAAEARGALTKVLGDAGTSVYLQTGGRWLLSIEEAASRAVSPPGNSRPAVRLPGGG